MGGADISGRVADLQRYGDGFIVGINALKEKRPPSKHLKAHCPVIKCR